MGIKESVSLDITKPDNIVEKINEEINDANIPKIEESIKDVDDTISTSSDTDNGCNDTSVNSTSDTGKLENTTLPLKKLTPQQILKRQESAKRIEERERIKQVSFILYITSYERNCIIFLILENNVNI